MLNLDSPVPLYHQLSDILAEKIRSGEYAKGHKIPSEHQLAADYNIGRPTARQATDLLVRKGLLVRKRGAGTFVTEPRRELDVLSLAGTIASFEKQGEDFSIELLDTIALIHVPNQRQNPFSGSKAYYFSRLTKVADTPVLLEEIYLNPRLFPRMDQLDLRGQSLSRIVKDRYYLKPVGGKQDFKITFLSDNRAKIMDVAEKAPILAVNRYIHFSQMKNGIYSELYCRTDRFVFSQILGGANNG